MVTEVTVTVFSKRLGWTLGSGAYRYNFGNLLFTFLKIGNRNFGNLIQYQHF